MTLSTESVANGAANGSSPKRTVCVFCGARAGASPAYLQAARDLATAFHKNNINLVYGGGTVGIMGEVAKTLVSLSGPESVHGIIPAALIKYEQNYDPSSPDQSAQNAIDEKIYGRTTIVKDMHSRKHMMAQEVIAGGPGSGFVALPGGYGTLEELMEVVTWNQLGIHERGIVCYNVEGYWDGLIKWVDTAVTQKFVDESNRSILVEATSADDVLRKLEDYQNTKGRFKLEWEHNKAPTPVPGSQAAPPAR